MKRSIKIVWLVFALLLPASLLANSEVKEKFSDSELVQIFKDNGYSSVKHIQDKVIVIAVNGRKYLLANYSDGDLQLTYMASGVKLSYKDINQWNSSKRLSRAYIDDGNSMVLQSDLMSNGGISRKNISEFFRVFRQSTDAFRDFLLKHDKS